MSRLITTAIVPVASRDTAEALLAPYLASPNDPGVYTFSVPLMPLSGPADAEPTYYGCSSTLGPELSAVLPQLAAAVPGVEYNQIGFRQFNIATHWLGWLADRNLKPRVALLS